MLCEHSLSSLLLPCLSAQLSYLSEFLHILGMVIGHVYVSMKFAPSTAACVQFKRHKIKALTYTMIQPGEDAKEDADDFNMHSSSALLAVAAKKHSKALVMVNYAARGLMQEMMFGTLAMLVSRSCTMPLALIPPDYAVE
jgi:hypothetical protein